MHAWRRSILDLFLQPARPAPKAAPRVPKNASKAVRILERSLLYLRDKDSQASRGLALFISSSPSLEPLSLYSFNTDNTTDFRQ